jgi:molybdenum cofactor synthesis domain-containing protein
MIEAAVVTVSDRCAAGTGADTSGPAVAEMLRGRLGARVARESVVPDESRTISDTLKELASADLDLIVTVGGTGCGPRDVTPEATLAVLTREVPGLAEAMRAESARITPHAMLQRGVCGIRGRTLIVNLPGSLKGATENLGVIMPALPHAVELLRGHTEHPGPNA